MHDQLELPEIPLGQAVASIDNQVMASCEG
jgi:hypothetical protein